MVRVDSNDIYIDRRTRKKSLIEKKETLRVGFEPTRENPSDSLSRHYVIQVRRLNHSAITARLDYDFDLVSIMQDILFYSTI